MNIGKQIIAAWNEWARSEEGEMALNVASLGASTEPGIYLTNRLQHAFISGLEKGYDMALSEMKKAVPKVKYGRKKRTA